MTTVGRRLPDEPLPPELRPPEQSLTNISPVVRDTQATQAGLEKYNKFYDNYTGLIDNMNGIGGGAAVAGGAAPTPALGF